jgi:hypothetical protein
VKQYLTALVPLAAIAVGCTQTDYYSEVAGVCSYTVKGGIVFGEAAEKTSLTTACKSALENILPYDDSWKHAPTGMKDKVTEAFQALVGYPLKFPPENRILGVAPWSFTPWHHDAFAAEENHNKSIFNYVLNRINSIEYSEENGTTSAFYCPSINGGTVTVYDAYWKDNLLSFYYSGPALRAQTLVHEARHADGYIHPPGLCGGVPCDADLDGPYGFGVAYAEMLLHGSAHLLSTIDLLFIGVDLCVSLENNFSRLPPEVERLLKDFNCGTQATAKWIAEREGITLPR